MYFDTELPITRYPEYCSFSNTLPHFLFFLDTFPFLFLFSAKSQSFFPAPHKSSQMEFIGRISLVSKHRKAQGNKFDKPAQKCSLCVKLMHLRSKIYVGQTLTVKNKNDTSFKNI